MKITKNIPTMEQILRNLKELKFYRFDHHGIKVGTKYEKSNFKEKVTSRPPGVWKLSESL